VPTARRRDDIRLLMGATLLVLAVGGLLFVGIYFSTRGGNSPTCPPQLPVGSVDSIRSEVQSGPYFATGGGQCSFLLALDGGDIVAYKLHPRGQSCTIKPKGDGFECDGKLVDRADLAQYPTSIQSQHGTDILIVNLGPVQSIGSTTASTG
jgi:hypothetical protein